MYRINRSNTGPRDAGSALVVAIAVSAIGVALATVVVSQAIIVMNDAARDRIRTVEIHSAEAALDATFKVLETTTPCSTTMSVGKAPQAVNVTVAIQYYSSTAELTCTNGTLSGKPVKAVVTSSSVPTAGGSNGGTERRIEATVNLVPQTKPSFGAAVFAGGNMAVSNSGIIEPLDPNVPAQVWISGSSWSCPNTYTIDGDVIIPSGNATMSNACRIKGNLWVKSGLTAANTARIDKNVTVYSGNVSVSNSVYFGGNLSVGGTYNFSNTPTIVGTLCSTNKGIRCGTLPLYAPKALPEVDYKLTDWTNGGNFTGKTVAQFGNDVVSQLTFSNTWAKPQYLANPCRMDNNLPNPVKLPAGNFVYNLTGCDFASSNTRTIEVNGNIAIFAKSFTTSNQFLVKSGDGQPHSVWFIVPDGGTQANGLAECTARGTYSPGSIQFSNQTDIAAGIDLFTYTPCDQSISNSTDLRGQIYGRNIATANNFHLLYSGMGIPGVDLGGTPTTAPAGYKVEIVNKHEIQN